MFAKWIPFAMYSYNTFCSPNQNGFSPYKLVFGRKPKLITNLETDPNVKVSGTFKLSIIHNILMN